MMVNSEVRNQLALLARRKEARLVGHFSKGMPSDWRPTQVINPSTGEYFTESGAWNFIADAIESGCDISQIILKVPPGKKAYVIEIESDPDTPKNIYEANARRGANHWEKFSL